MIWCYEDKFEYFVFVVFFFIIVGFVFLNFEGDFGIEVENDF